MPVFDPEKIEKIKQYLRRYPRGLTISDLTIKSTLNRNMVAKYLDMLLISGQVEMQEVGAAKVYFLSHRVPISAMLEFSSDFVIVFDTNQQIIQVNEPVLKLLNDTREALIGKNIHDINHPLVHCILSCDPVKNDQISGDKVTEISCNIHDETLHFRLKQVPTAFEDGTQGITFIFEDITAKKRYEESLKMSEARYRGIVEDQTEFITRFNPDGTLTFVNDSYARYLGSTPADLLGRHLTPGINDEDCAVLNQTLQSLDKEHPVTTIDYRVSTPSGRVYWNLWTIRAIFDDKGILHEYQGVGRDNTEKREAAAKINNYIKIMEFLSQTGKTFMDMDEDDDIYQYVAQQVYSLAPGFLVWVGYLDEPNEKLILKSVVGNPIALDTMQQITGTPVADMTFPINKAETSELIRHRRLVKTPSLFRLLHMQVPDEKCRQIEEAAGGIESYLMGLVSKGRILGDVGISLQRGSELPNRELIEAFIRQAAIAIDRKIAEDALKRSEQQYRSVIDNIQDIFYRTDRDGNLIMASPSWAHILGYNTLGECIGRNIADTFYLEPAKRKEFLDAVCRYGEVRDYEVVLKRKDGTPLFIAVSSHQYYDESGDVLGIEGIMRDVTERHAASEKIRDHIAQMEFLSRSATAFIDMGEDEDIYQFIAEKIHTLVPDSMVGINSFNPVTRTMLLRTVKGSEEDMATLFHELGDYGRKLGELQLPIDIRPDSIEIFKKKTLEDAPPLYDMFFHQIPQEICTRAEERVPLGRGYAMGFVCRGGIFGSVIIKMKKGVELKNRRIVEAFISQAAVALLRRHARSQFRESERKRAEDALRTSENYLVKIFNSTQSGLVVIDPETHLIFDANSTAAELIGTDKSSLVGSSCKKWLCPTENDLCPVMDLGQQLVRSEGILNNVKGEMRSVIKTVVPVQLGGREYLLESFVDITKRKKAEEALRESEKRFRDLAGMLPQCVWECDAEGTLTFVNNRGLEMYRYESGDLDKCLTIWQTVHPDDRERVRHDVIQDFEDFYRGTHKFPGFVHYTALRKDRSTFPCDTYATLMVRDNQIVGMRGMGIDLTERNNAEEALRESEERLSGVVENAPIGIAFSDSHSGVIEYINPEFVKILGYTLGSNPNMADWFEQMYPDPEYRQKLYENWMNDIPRLGGTNTNSDNIFRVRCKDGSDKDIRWRVVHFTNGKALMIIEDFTERKRAEEALKESEERFRGLVENAPIGIAFSDSHTAVIEYLNPEFEKLFGYTHKEYPDLCTLFEQMYPDNEYRKKIYEIWRDDLHRSGGTNAYGECSLQVRCKDGSDRDIWSRLVHFSNGKALTIFEDITGQRLVR